MLQTNFTQQVLNDIHDFLNQNDRVFANKHDLQMNLAVYLKCMKHYDIEVEYHVPSGIIDTLLPQTLPMRFTYYPWFQANSDRPQEIYVDLVVSNGEEYVPVMLKYKKKELKVDVKLFGQNMGKGILMKADAKHDFRRYDFWKDVRRMEFLVDSFEKVKNGIVLFVTNDESYKTASVAGTNSEYLAMCDGTDTYRKNKNCCWPFNPLMMNTYKSCPNFMLENEHDVNWKRYIFSGVDFHCAEVRVTMSNLKKHSIMKFENMDKFLREIGRAPLLTKAKESALLKAVQEKGEDCKEMEQLCQSNMRFVVAAATQYQNRGIKLEELITIGAEGLKKAAMTYDFDSGTPFIKHAVSVIRKSLECLFDESEDAISIARR